MATLPLSLEPLLHRTPLDPRPIVLLTCGISGAGKSTLSKLVTSRYPSFTRLSIDTIIHQKHGLYGIDYTPEKYSEYQDEARREYDERLIELLSDKDQKHDIVLDRSFYAKEDRDEFKKVVEDKGGRWILVYLKASKEVLQRRIAERRAKGKDADSAFEVTEEVLDRYWSGFEAPYEEGEFVVEVL
jgi:predicted kinase